mmetsp:Transcript_7918/g.24456  ORF Transcript_7918/g.24456 Transcript_7918/m.24456 type:complete len:263 (-) Transcript_7918:349-1137(-)
MDERMQEGADAGEGCTEAVLAIPGEQASDGGRHNATEQVVGGSRDLLLVLCEVLDAKAREGIRAERPRQASHQLGAQQTIQEAALALGIGHGRREGAVRVEHVVAAVVSQVSFDVDGRVQQDRFAAAEGQCAVRADVEQTGGQPHAHGQRRIGGAHAVAAVGTAVDQAVLGERQHGRGAQPVASAVEHHHEREVQALHSAVHVLHERAQLVAGRLGAVLVAAVQLLGVATELDEETLRLVDVLEAAGHATHRHRLDTAPLHG